LTLFWKKLNVSVKLLRKPHEKKLTATVKARVKNKSK